MLAIMRIPLQRSPRHSLSVPVGFELYLKPAQALKLNVPYRSRSQLAHHMLKFIAEQLPDVPSVAWRMAAMPRKTMSVSSPIRPMLLDASQSTPSSSSCRHHRPPSGARPTQKRRPDRLAEDPGADRHGMVTPPQRSGRGDASLGWLVARGVAWALRAGRGAAA